MSTSDKKYERMQGLLEELRALAAATDEKVAVLWAERREKVEKEEKREVRNKRDEEERRKAVAQIKADEARRKNDAEEKALRDHYGNG
jgi:hypothetical protein